MLPGHGCCSAPDRGCCSAPAQGGGWLVGMSWVSQSNSQIHNTVFTRKLVFAYNFCRPAEHTPCIFTAFGQAGMTSALREPSSLRASPACPCPAPRHWAGLVPSTAAGCQQVCWEVVAVGIPHLPDPLTRGAMGTGFGDTVDSGDRQRQASSAPALLQGSAKRSSGISRDVRISMKSTKP